jgi:IS30 family transposase
VFVVRGDRSPQGRRKLDAERLAYLDLVASGVGTTEACRIVGVNRRTGHRWRHGRADRPVGEADRPSPPPPAPPSPTPASVSTGRYLSVGERLVIADLLREGRSLRSIAARLGRDVSTVSREVGRNRDPASGEYRPHTAQQRAEARRPRPGPGRIATDPHLRDLVRGMLAERFSPEQISRRLRRDHPHRPELHVSTETIYQALYVQGRGELRRELAAALRTGRTARRTRRADGQRRPRFTAPMVMISDRPAEVEDRAVPGHWEGDLIIGAGRTSAIGTLVERATRYLLLVHLPDRHDAETVRDGLISTITTLPAHLRRSLTWDQGSEMGRHHEFTLATDMPVYFCDPHSPWQRGSNENTNGLLRQYFPKGTDLSLHSPEDLAAVAAQLNRRPRKTLGWDTPAERLTTLLTHTS